MVGRDGVGAIATGAGVGVGGRRPTSTITRSGECSRREDSSPTPRASVIRSTCPFGSSPMTRRERRGNDRSTWGLASAKRTATVPPSAAFTVALTGRLRVSTRVVVPAKSAAAARTVTTGATRAPASMRYPPPEDSR
jgi:hypothetical protein